MTPFSRKLTEEEKMTYGAHRKFLNDCTRR
jgi:hypothetical protein